MSSASPTRTTSTRLFFSKNVRLNLNSKFIPEDFFPESISQYSRSRRKSQKQNHLQSPKILSPRKDQNQDIDELEKQTKNLELLKKRLIRIKQSSPTSSEHDSNKKICLKKRSSSRKGERKLINGQKQVQTMQSQQKNKSRACSRKLMDYMRKMRDVINIDIKFQEDNICPVYQKVPEEVLKQNPQDVQTDDSPKLKRYRPRSQLNKRVSNQNVKNELNKLMPKPLKIKAKQTHKIMRESAQKCSSKKSDRYNKFCDIQLNEQGMLTFYGSSNQKDRESYDSKKYSTRSSLPKLQK